MVRLKTYRVVVRLEGKELPPIEIEGEDWTEVCDYVFGNIEVIEVDEKGVEK